MDKLQKVKEALEDNILIDQGYLEIAENKIEIFNIANRLKKNKEALAELKELMEGESLKNDVIQSFNKAREKWDSEADVYNKWDNLSLEEQDDTKANAAINVIKGGGDD